MWFPQLGLKAFPYGAFVGGTMHEDTLIHGGFLYSLMDLFGFGFLSTGC